MIPSPFTYPSDTDAILAGHRQFDDAVRGILRCYTALWEKCLQEFLLKTEGCAPPLAEVAEHGYRVKVTDPQFVEDSREHFFWKGRYAFTIVEQDHQFFQVFEPEKAPNAMRYRNGELETANTDTPSSLTVD